MKKISIISAAITFVCLVGLLFFLAPGTMRMNVERLAIIALIIILPVAVGIAIGIRIKKRRESLFYRNLVGLDLAFDHFFSVMYAYGKYRGLYVSFKPSRIMKGDLVLMLPGSTSVVILCRFKIPGTEYRRIHCAFFSEMPGTALRKVMNWTSPEPGIFLYKEKNRKEGAMLDTYNMLKADTKRKLKEIARLTGSCAITKDWESVMLGKKNSLKLLHGDEKALAELDLQIKIPLGSSREELVSILDTAVEAVGALSYDLSF